MLVRANNLSNSQPIAPEPTMKMFSDLIASASSRPYTRVISSDSVVRSSDNSVDISVNISSGSKESSDSNSCICVIGVCIRDIALIDS
mmetsp:Transcript_4534/g.4061  ORF Transcript_4534/g.4061 Transcript_4534/m.4061 type:complete len:88 (+) Transcript_4534:26-289(+)